MSESMKVIEDIGEENAMHNYEYEGPVMVFGICVMNHWKGATRAVSEAKARSNLAYQWKKQNNRVAGSNITLPGRIKIVD